MPNRITQIRNVPALQQQGGQPFGAPINQNVSGTTIAATGNFPARPTGAGISPAEPQIFTWPVTAAAAVVLTARATPDASGKTVDGYIPGDVVGVMSTAALANTVTIKDGNGAATRAVLGTTATNSAAYIQWDGTNWNWYPPGSVNVS